MNMIAAGKPFTFNKTTITPLHPVPEDKSDEVVDIEKRNKHIIISLPESVQRRWETNIFARLPFKPSLSPFRFHGKLCLFIDDASLFNEEKQPITNIVNGLYKAKIYFKFPSINEKDGDSYLKIKPVSIMLFNKSCPW